MKTPVNRRDPKWQRRMTNKLMRTFDLSPNDAQYFQSLFDPTQTHAIYGITKDDLEHYKEQLKKLGANKFRAVTASSKHLKILCFNATNIELPLL